MGFFDAFQTTAFNIITNTFGVTATWVPALGREPFTAEVLYKDPTEKQTLIDSDFDIESCLMEYKMGDLPGFKEAVNSGGTIQTVTIQDGDNAPVEYWAKEVTSKYDGKTLIAKIARKNGLRSS